MDNHATHKRVEVRDWLAANPRIHVHFTPTSGSWLNLVEVWFGIIERQAVSRGTFRSVRELNTKIRAFITGWNTRKHPFVWTKTPDEILAKINPKRTQHRTTSVARAAVSGRFGHPAPRGTGKAPAHKWADAFSTSQGWRWRESNPRPRTTNQNFSGRSWLGVLSAPALAPARCRQAQP